MFNVVIIKCRLAYFRFTYVYCGCNGRVSDGGVWKQTSLHQDLESGENRYGIPAPAPLPDCPTGEPMPHVIVADDAFALSENIMKPYPR